VEWQRVPGLPLIWLAVLLIVLGFALAVSAAALFRREGTEIDPTSPINRKLVRSGPFSFTRNPMYLGLTVAALYQDSLIMTCRPNRAYRWT